jgi:hypothetical protein
MTINGAIMITGSRDVDREEARTLFEQHLLQFISQGRTWLVGTAHRVDLWTINGRRACGAGGSVKPGVKQKPEPQGNR